MPAKQTKKVANKKTGEAISSDKLRRADQPDSADLTVTEEEAKLSPDGGASDHPIHDEPLEDMQPEDFEAAIDDAAKAKLERRDEDVTIDPRANRESSAGSSDPLDQKNRRPLRIPNP